MKKKHHRISAFYLRHFAVLDPKEQIWTYDLETDTVRASTADATGYEKHLYSVTLPDGTRSAEIEDLIAAIEDRAAPAHARLVAGDTLSDEQRSDFASFMALMFVRTDAFRQQYAESTMGLLQAMNFMTASDDEAFNTQIEQYQRDTGRRLSEEEIKRLRDGLLDPQGFVFEVNKEWTLQALALHNRFVRIFFKMHWSVLDVAPQRFLITSDNPLVYGVPDADRHPIYGGGLAHKKVEVTLPLSSQKSLLATWNEEIPRRAEIGREGTKNLNRLRAVYAMRYLFAPVKDGGIRALGRKYKDSRPGIKISGGGPAEYSPVRLRRRRD